MSHLLYLTGSFPRRPRLQLPQAAPPAASPRAHSRNWRAAANPTSPHLLLDVTGRCLCHRLMAAPHIRCPSRLQRELAACCTRLLPPRWVPPAAAGELPSAPDLLLDVPGQRVWHKLDERFRVPKAAVLVQLHPWAQEWTAGQAAATQLAVKLLEDALCETTYLASTAGLQYEVGCPDCISHAGPACTLFHGVLDDDDWHHVTVNQQ